MMRWSIKSRVTAACGTVVLSLLLGGCLKKSNVEPVAVKTYLSIMHLASAAPAADVYINNYRETQDPIPPGVSFSYYAGTTPGQLEIKFKKAGSDSLIAALPGSSYDSLQFYTLILYNDPINMGKVKAIKIKDDFSLIKRDKTIYRFFNMNSDMGAVNFYIENELVSSGRTNADIVDNDYLSGFQQFAPGSYIIKAKLAATDSLLAQSTAQLAADNAYTVFLHGFSNSTGVKTSKLVVLRATN